MKDLGGLKQNTKKKGERGRVGGERDNTYLIDFEYDRRQPVGFRKERESKTFLQLHVFVMDDDLCYRVLR